MQDVDDEHHFLLRPLERTSFNDFKRQFWHAMATVQAKFEIWDVDLVNMIARRVEDGNA